MKKQYEPLEIEISQYATPFALDPSGMSWEETGEGNSDSWE